MKKYYNKLILTTTIITFGMISCKKDVLDLNSANDSMYHFRTATPGPLKQVIIIHPDTTKAR